MRIRPYIKSDFDVIRNWNTDERTHALWCANLIRYPLDKENFEEKLAEMSLKYGDTPYVAADDDGKNSWLLLLFGEFGYKRGYAEICNGITGVSG